jgi:DNA repair exonuclease SbcCD nuclease subunit
MSFKLALVSDLHMGYASTRMVDEQNINLRVGDGYRALADIVTQIIDHEADAVLVPGDTFHIPEPKIRDIVYAQNQFRRFYEAGIPVYILAGNHDALDIASEIAASRVLHDPLRRIFSHVEPYVEYEIADGINLHMVSHHLYHDQADTFKKIKPHEGAINIFSTHGSVVDPLLKLKLHTEQSPREIVIPDSLLNEKGWSYSMLGHIHERGWIGSKDKKTDTSDTRTFYSGSVLRRGFSDKDVPLGKGWTLWTIDPDGTFTPEFFNTKQRPQGDFKPIDAANLTASDITDRIIQNLKRTAGHGEPLNFREAPILRQTVVNLAPAKHQALDWKSISANSDHAMQWSLKTTTMLEEVTDKETGDTINMENADILRVYEDWVDNSDAITRVSEDHRALVVEQGRKLIESGRDGVLEDA